jgi:23S rRNA (cytosine1962-C5)-methyltransferase
MKLEPTILTSQWNEYELIDLGNGRKFERIGSHTLIRPEPDALWEPTLSEDKWKADFIYKKQGKDGSWEKGTTLPSSWNASFNDLTFSVSPTPFGHISIFPEQAVQWQWIQETIKDANRPVSVLSLFGYTGAATLAAAAAGATVTHVDASRPAISQAVENQKLSKLQDKPIRWILDDAVKFVKREERRGKTYDAIIMDPPKFGRGPKGEVWQFEDSFPELLDACINILSNNPLFVLVTAYTIPTSSITIGQLLDQKLEKYKGETDFGELVLKSSSSEKVLPTSLFARWKA